MATFTVHLPRDATPSEGAADRIRLVREGFSFLALVFPALWLIFNRMWLVLLGWIAVVVAIEALAYAAGDAVATIVAVVFAVWFALEARDLQRWTLARKGYETAAVVVADDVDAAERRFIEAWLDGPGLDGGVPAPPAPRRPATGIPAPIGLFPIPGGR
jgi:hypothetical protein